MSPSLHEWVELWFGPRSRADSAPALVTPLLSFNHEPSETCVDDGVKVLVIENQGVWLWGRTADGYVERENEPGQPWQPIAEDEEAFWLHHAAFEAVWSMPAQRSAMQLDGAAVTRLVELSNALPCAPWAWPGQRQEIRSHGRALVMLVSDGDDFWVVVAGPSEADLGWVDELALDWDASDSPAREDPAAVARPDQPLTD
jgi:hypothetical protein